MHQPTRDDAPQAISRREFLGKIAAGSLTGAGILVLVGSLDLSLPPAIRSSRSIKLGASSSYPMSRFTFIPGSNLFLYRERHAVSALSAICPHLGCVVRKGEGGFRCPCHGSRFDEEGRVLSGPAARSLDWLRVRRAPDGQLVVLPDEHVEPGEGLQI
ncbi:MAG: ubiquinol-cytochrome c reductase iron-sulfur subunit [Bacteroidota bacterium]